MASHAILIHPAAKFTNTLKTDITWQLAIKNLRERDVSHISRPIRKVKSLKLLLSCFFFLLVLCLLLFSFRAAESTVNRVTRYTRTYWANRTERFVFCSNFAWLLATFRILPISSQARDSGAEKKNFFQLLRHLFTPSSSFELAWKKQVRIMA